MIRVLFVKGWFWEALLWLAIVELARVVGG
jgi:hypothetical protein